MAWDILEAAWKGLKFHVERVDDELKQRVATHRYPKRDGAEQETMGRDPVSLQLRAVWFGAGYKQRLGIFRDEVAVGEPGTLIHPVYGSIYVVCTAMRVTHDWERAHFASAELTFLEDQIDDQLAFQELTGTQSTAGNEARTAAATATGLLADL